MVRLNLLTVLLAYTMNTDYMFYYFAPLVSMWYIIIYTTLLVASRYNEYTSFLLCKIFLSSSLVTWFFKSEWLLEVLFGFLKDVFNIQWAAHEWTFRVTLDLWVTYIGMLVAILVIKVREHKLTDRPMWPLTVKAAAVVSGLVLVWFFGFELMQESKFAYNAWHPYISPLPVLAFVVLRNANATLRSTASTGFIFVGKCSLELFVMQYHFWLAGDTKGVLLVIPGTKWRPVNFVLTSFVFLYLSHRVANAIGEVTRIVCMESQRLPITQIGEVPLSSHSSLPSSGLPTDLERKGTDGNIESGLPMPSTSQGRWIDRLADGRLASRDSGSARLRRVTEWMSGLGWRAFILLSCLWILNIFWTYPE